MRDSGPSLVSGVFIRNRAILLPPSAIGRIVGIALATTGFGAAIGMCVAVSLIAARSADTSISAHQTLATALPVARLTATSDVPGIFLPVSMSFSQRMPEIVSEPLKASPAVAAVPKTRRIQANGRLEPATAKKRVTKKRYSRKRWRDDHIRQRLALMERLKPQ